MSELNWSGFRILREQGESSRIEMVLFTEKGAARMVLLGFRDVLRLAREASAVAVEALERGDVEMDS